MKEDTTYFKFRQAKFDPAVIKRRIKEAESLLLKWNEQEEKGFSLKWNSKDLNERTFNILYDMTRNNFDWEIIYFCISKIIIREYIFSYLNIGHSPIYPQTFRENFIDIICAAVFEKYIKKHEGINMIMSDALYEQLQKTEADFINEAEKTRYSSGEILDRGLEGKEEAEKSPYTDKEYNLFRDLKGKNVFDDTEIYEIVSSIRINNSRCMNPILNKNFRDICGHKKSLQEMYKKGEPRNV